jgi:hypothetical protein
MGIGKIHPIFIGITWGNFLVDNARTLPFYMTFDNPVAKDGAVLCMMFIDLPDGC